MRQLELFPKIANKEVGKNKREKRAEKNSILLITWNVNSVRARQVQVYNWIEENEPEIICLQEIKVDDDNFPYNDFIHLGYKPIVYGQKSYNGVAILTKLPVKSQLKGFENNYFNKDARIIHANMIHFHLITVYVPNAKNISDESFNYKLKWLGELYNLVNKRFTPNDRLIICGDFNVAPNQLDVDDPRFYLYETFIHKDVRYEFNKLLNWGLVDSFHLRNPSSGNYTWWDYRGDAFHKNKGMRIDHILVSTNLKNSISSITIDKNTRSASNPSDHAPVVAELTL